MGRAGQEWVSQEFAGDKVRAFVVNKYDRLLRGTRTTDACQAPQSGAAAGLSGCEQILFFFLRRIVLETCLPDLLVFVAPVIHPFRFAKKSPGKNERRDRQPQWRAAQGSASYAMFRLRFQSCGKSAPFGFSRGQDFASVRLLSVEVPEVQDSFSVPLPRKEENQTGGASYFAELNHPASRFADSALQFRAECSTCAFSAICFV